MPVVQRCREAPRTGMMRVATWPWSSLRSKPAADGPRYKALGNAMACNVMAWIGARISLFERVVLGRNAA